MRTLVLTAFAASALATTSPASANLISNGDFSNGGPNFANWTESIVGVSNQANSAGLGWSIVSVFGAVSQTFTVTSASLYEVVFDTVWRGTGFQYVAAALTQSNPLTIIVADSFSSGAQQSFSAFLNPGTYTLSFGGNDVAIDNVSVTAVPGPIAAAGLPGVLALIGYAAWRRRSTPVA